MPLEPFTILQVAFRGGEHASPGLLPEHAIAELHSPARSPQVQAASARHADDAIHAVTIANPTATILAGMPASRSTVSERPMRSYRDPGRRANAERPTAARCGPTGDPVRASSGA
jgi:hypothetical protein